jgi:hypothetical protein
MAKPPSEKYPEGIRWYPLWLVWVIWCH